MAINCLNTTVSTAVVRNKTIYCTVDAMMCLGIGSMDVRVGYWVGIGM